MKFKDIRVFTKKANHVWIRSDFAIRKAQVVSNDTDISIFACGHMVWNAIKAWIFLKI